MTDISPTDRHFLTDLIGPRIVREFPIRPQDPEIEQRVHDALRSDREVHVIFPGTEVESPDSMVPSGMTENTTYLVGEVVPADGSWRIDDDGVLFPIDQQDD